MGIIISENLRCYGVEDGGPSAGGGRFGGGGGLGCDNSRRRSAAANKNVAGGGLASVVRTGALRRGRSWAPFALGWTSDEQPHVVSQARLLRGYTFRDDGDDIDGTRAALATLAPVTYDEPHQLQYQRPSLARVQRLAQNASFT